MNRLSVSIGILSSSIVICSVFFSLSDANSGIAGNRTAGTTFVASPAGRAVSIAVAQAGGNTYGSPNQLSLEAECEKKSLPRYGYDSGTTALSLIEHLRNAIREQNITAFFTYTPCPIRVFRAESDIYVAMMPEKFLSVFSSYNPQINWDRYAIHAFPDSVSLDLYQGDANSESVGSIDFRRIDGRWEWRLFATSDVSLLSAFGVPDMYLKDMKGYRGE